MLRELEADDDNPYSQSTQSVHGHPSSFVPSMTSNNPSLSPANTPNDMPTMTLLYQPSQQLFQSSFQYNYTQSNRDSDVLPMLPTEEATQVHSTQKQYSFESDDKAITAEESTNKIHEDNTNKNEQHTSNKRTSPSDVDCDCIPPSSTANKQSSSSTSTSSNRDSDSESDNSSIASNDDKSIGEVTNKVHYNEIVSESDWYNALQEEPATASNKNTVCKNYPELWQVVGNYTECWSKNGWSRASDKKKKSHFKTMVVKHIVKKRHSENKNDHRDIYEMLTKENKKKNGKNAIMIYDKEAFERFATENWKLEADKNQNLPKDHINDTIRLFSIAAKSEYREKLMSLVRGKAMCREQMDGPTDYKTEIFEEFAEDFNDATEVFDKPQKSSGLSSIDLLNPNDSERISIERNAKFLYELWKKRMYEYKVGVKKWCSDTGGGSGDPLNFHNWDDLSVSDFANYGGGSGRAVRKEWMSYILLLDMKTEYAFSSSFEAPPEDAVVEDGMGEPTAKRQRQSETSVEEAGMEMFKKMGRVQML